MKKSKNKKIKRVEKKRKTYKNNKIKKGGSYQNNNCENHYELISNLYKEIESEIALLNLTDKDIGFLKKVRNYLYNLINIDISGKGSGGIYFIETHSCLTGNQFRIKPESPITIVFVTNTSRSVPIHALKFIKDNIDDPTKNILNIFNHGNQLEMPESALQRVRSYTQGNINERDYVYEYRIHFPGTMINDQLIVYGQTRGGDIGGSELVCEGIFPFTDNNLRDNLLFHSELHPSSRPIYNGRNKIFMNCKEFGMNNMINDESLKKLYEFKTEIYLSQLINQLEEQNFRGTLVLMACRNDRFQSSDKTQLIRKISSNADQVFDISEGFYTICKNWFDKNSTYLYRYISKEMSNFDKVGKYSIHPPITTEDSLVTAIEDSWLQLWDAERAAYYYWNRRTGEVTWIVPEGFNTQSMEYSIE